MADGVLVRGMIDVRVYSSRGHKGVYTRYSATLCRLPGHDAGCGGSDRASDNSKLHLRLVAAFDDGHTEMRTFTLGSDRITSFSESGAVVVEVGPTTLEIKPPSYAAGLLWLSALMHGSTTHAAPDQPSITHHGWF